ncbi:hypothetical protein D3C79_675240 [compost metagenome]
MQFFVKSASVLVKVHTHQKDLVEAGMVGNLQRYVRHGAGVEKAAVQVLAEPQRLFACAWKGPVADQFVVFAQQVGKLCLARLAQKVQLAAGCNLGAVVVILPERDSFTSVHGLGKQLGLLVGEIPVRADIEERFDRCIDEHRDRAVHRDHRNIGECLEREVFCRAARGDNEH